MWKLFLPDRPLYLDIHRGLRLRQLFHGNFKRHIYKNNHELSLIPTKSQCSLFLFFCQPRPHQLKNLPHRLRYIRIINDNRLQLSKRLLGLAGGWWLNTPEPSALAQNTLYGAKLVGTLFLDLLRMVLVPLIFSSIVIGVANLRAHEKMAFNTRAFHKSFKQSWSDAFIYTSLSKRDLAGYDYSDNIRAFLS